MLSVTLLAWSKSSRGMKVRGVARVGAYLGVVGLVAGVFATHNAHASVAEGSLQFGRDMMELKEYIQAPTAFTLNGEKMVLATGTSDKKAHDILDSYETYCRAAKGSLGKEWSDLAAQPLSSHETKVASKLGGAFDMGVYRVEHDGEGSVMCFMRSEGTQKNLLTSLQAFEHTHDLGSLGKMRYAYVRALSDGRSMVFTAWTDEHFRLDSFIPNGKQDAADKLIERFELSDEQADAILEMKVYRLARLEILVIQKEAKEKRAEQRRLKELLGSDLETPATRHRLQLALDLRRLL